MYISNILSSISFQPLLQPLTNRIYAFWKHICYAYYAKPLDKVVLPIHPVPNPYPKDYKKAPWPSTSISPQTKHEHVRLKGRSFRKGHPFACGGLRQKRQGHLPARSRRRRCQRFGYQRTVARLLGRLLRQSLRSDELKNLGAKLDEADYRGKTPLRAAAKYGHTPIVSFLISQNVTLDKKDGRGVTPMEMAAFHQSFSVFETLAYHKAEPFDDARALLRKKSMEVYHNRPFILRLFTSPNPPKLIENFEKLRL